MKQGWARAHVHRVYPKKENLVNWIWSQAALYVLWEWGGGGGAGWFGFPEPLPGAAQSFMGTFQGRCWTLPWPDGFCSPIFSNLEHFYVLGFWYCFLTLWFSEITAWFLQLLLKVLPFPGLGFHGLETWTHLELPGLHRCLCIRLQLLLPCNHLRSIYALETVSRWQGQK